MDLLRAADEADAGQAVAPAVEGFLGGGDDLRMVGQAEVVVGAEVQHRPPPADADAGLLRRGDDPLALEEPGGADLVELPARCCLSLIVHGIMARFRRLSFSQVRITLPELPDRITSKPFSNSV